MRHAEEHPMAGRRVRLAAHMNDPELDGAEYWLEDWWDRAYGSSWMSARGNPAALKYAIRTGFQESPVPCDDEVVYGHVGGLGHLVHISELGEVLG